MPTPHACTHLPTHPRIHPTRTRPPTPHPPTHPRTRPPTPHPPTHPPTHASPHPRIHPPTHPTPTRPPTPTHPHPPTHASPQACKLPEDRDLLEAARAAAAALMLRHRGGPLTWSRELLACVADDALLSLDTLELPCLDAPGGEE